MNVTLQLRFFESKQDSEPVYVTEAVTATLQKGTETKIQIPIAHSTTLLHCKIDVTFPKTIENETLRLEFGRSIVENVYSCVSVPYEDGTKKWWNLFSWWWPFDFVLDIRKPEEYSTTYSEHFDDTTGYGTLTRSLPMCLLCYTKPGECKGSNEILEENNRELSLQIVLAPLEDTLK